MTEQTRWKLDDEGFAEPVRATGGDAALAVSELAPPVRLRKPVGLFDYLIVAFLAVLGVALLLFTGDSSAEDDGTFGGIFGPDAVRYVALGWIAVLAAVYVVARWVRPPQLVLGEDTLALKTWFLPQVWPWSALRPFEVTESRVSATRLYWVHEADTSGATQKIDGRRAAWINTRTFLWRTDAATAYALRDLLEHFRNRARSGNAAT